MVASPRSPRVLFPQTTVLRISRPFLGPALLSVVQPKLCFLNPALRQGAGGDGFEHFINVGHCSGSLYIQTPFCSYIVTPIRLGDFFGLLVAQSAGYSLRCCNDGNVRVSFSWLPLFFLKNVCFDVQGVIVQSGDIELKGRNSLLQYFQSRNYTNGPMN
jgi:hypothetical protein